MVSILPAHATTRFRTAFLTLLLAGLWGGRAAAQTNPPDSAGHGVPIWVGDFELDSIGAKPKPPVRTAEVPQKQIPGSPPVYNDADAPSAQARRLTEFLTASLLQAFGKKGLSAARAEGNKGTAGALIRGIFAEPDMRNRIRRAQLGGGSPNPRFLLYVGIFNLARQEQALYQLAPAQSPDDRYGPVITLNTYIPLAKYELDKNPSEEEVKKICDQIVASLVSLLEKNPNAFAQ
jgi:hypothetical protein